MIVEPLYKGQVGDRSFVRLSIVTKVCTIVEPLYKGQVGDGFFASQR